MDKPEPSDAAKRVGEILDAVKPLAAEYYQLTGKPLGVTGEVAVAVAAHLLGLELAVARTAGYDAVRTSPAGPIRIQIKGRAFGEASKSQRLGAIKRGAACDIVMLVLLDNRTLEAREIWEAPVDAVMDRLDVPGSKARQRGALGVREFKRLGIKTWPTEAV